MSSPFPVWGFFYGGLINPQVMRRLGMNPRRREVAVLSGFDLTISPLVNLVRSPRHSVYGLLLELTHAELAHVYGQLAAVYWPYPVVAQDLLGGLRPALCYLAAEMTAAQAEVDHVMALLKPAEELGFPEWYLARIRSFLPSATRLGGT